MGATRDFDPIPLEGLEPDSDGPTPVGPTPTLDELSPDASGRIVRYIVTSTLERGVAPNAVVALYADLAGEEQAVRYADRRFILREVPADWRDVENRVLDLEQSARERGTDLAAAWRRATGVAMPGQAALEQLARLAGARESARPQRSIFDDPDDLEELEEADEDFQHARLADRAPDLVDLSSDAQQRIRRFAIEERLEHGLAPVELLDLYRGFELEGDDRARQYLDLVYVDREPPNDWLDLQSEAGRVMDVAEARGRDAGRLFADLLKASPGIEPAVGLRIILERLLA
ncbi:MAG: hypothetical protein JOZ81_09505 [Chloroflexi bacterium]|nr:hypothetical protein [Chloroflexota bacterium]